VTVAHFAYASDGGAARAGRRASLACQQNGVASCFAFIAGKPQHPFDMHLVLPKPDAEGAALARTLNERIQWEFIPDRRTPLTNSLLSIPYPGADVDQNRLLEMADIIHLHWPTWGVTPRAISRWLAAGRKVFWTLHDVWPMTGGCHYPAGCRQFETLCMKCPQLQDDFGLIGNAFAEKLLAYGDAKSLWIIAPSQWIADEARRSAILGRHRIEVVRNPVELDLFCPRDDRARLRQAFGIADHDFAMLMGSADLNERRKGTALLLAAIAKATADGSLSRALPTGARFHLILIGKTIDAPLPPEISPLVLGAIEDDELMADTLNIADVVATPSLEDNYPNLIVEAFACGTPVLAYATGGIVEMVEDGRTGVLVEPVGSVEALAQGLVRFIETLFGSMDARNACRSVAEKINDPLKIGAQFRALYEEALGRVLTPVDAVLQARVMAAFARTPARADARPGSRMLQFPSNIAVAQRASGRKIVRQTVATPLVPSRRRGVTRLVTVRTFHEHHSAHSGPYQFIRHLPDRAYEGRHFAVPLGADLAGPSAEVFRLAGALKGTPAFGQQGNAWLAEAEVLAHCAHEGADLVHFIDGELGGWLLPDVPALAFADGRKPAIVATYHQPDEILRGMINPDTLRKLDGVVALCEAQRMFLERFIDPAKIAVIPHGIDTQFFHPPETPHERESGKIRLLLVGHWLRDVEAALEAYNSVKKSEFAFELRIVSPRFPVGLSDPSIKLLKGLSDKALREEYWRADMLFLPLKDATANNAVLEALACGLPVVSTRVGGVPEAVGDDGAGLLCARGDARAYAEAIIAFARDPGLANAARAVARRRAELLDWSRIGRMHDAFYRAVLARRAQTPN